jgi:hypothetical protein
VKRVRRVRLPTSSPLLSWMSRKCGILDISQPNSSLRLIIYSTCFNDPHYNLNRLCARTVSSWIQRYVVRLNSVYGGTKQISAFHLLSRRRRNVLPKYLLTFNGSHNDSTPPNHRGESSKSTPTQALYWFSVAVAADQNPASVSC